MPPFIKHFNPFSTASCRFHAAQAANRMWPQSRRPVNVDRQKETTMTSNHFGGDRVSGGVYWSRKGKEFITVPGEGGRLGGCENDVYVKTPIWMVLLAGPLMGLAFA